MLVQTREPDECAGRVGGVQWGWRGTAPHWPGCSARPAPPGGREEGEAEGEGAPMCPAQRVCLRLFLQEVGRVCGELRVRLPVRPLSIHE